MSSAGEFRTRLTLQARSETPDGQGGVVRAYADAGKIWARVTPLAGRETMEADANGATIRVRIEARAPLALSLAHRLVDGAKVYRITAYRDDGRIVTIDAELRVV